MGGAILTLTSHISVGPSDLCTPPPRAFLFSLRNCALVSLWLSLSGTRSSLCSPSWRAPTASAPPCPGASPTPPTVRGVGGPRAAEHQLSLDVVALVGAWRQGKRMPNNGCWKQRVEAPMLAALCSPPLLRGSTRPRASCPRGRPARARRAARPAPQPPAPSRPCWWPSTRGRAATGTSGTTR